MSQGIRWAFNVKDWKPSKSQWKLCLQCVQSEESDRCNRFHFIEDCKSSLVGRLLMRRAVNELLSIEYDKITFARTSSGKPFLVGENEKNIFFNVSHNGDFCVLASELNIPLGVDVMKVQYRSSKPLQSYFECMKKQFSSFEWDFISLPGYEREQLERFYRLWCLKESYVKAIGTGIAYDLSTLSFSCKSPLKQPGIITDTQFYKDGIYQEKWKFEESFLNDDHCVAVALELDKKAEISKKTVDQYPKIFEVLDYDQLMKNCKPFANVAENFWEEFLSKEEKIKK